MPAPYDNEDMPAGAIRAMLRAPYSDPVPLPLPIPRVQPQRISAQPMSMPAVDVPSVPAPSFDWTQQTQNPWGTLLSGVTDTIRKYNKPTTIVNLDDALTAIKAQERPSPPAPTSDTYRRNARRIESGGDDNAVNPSSGATGRYQFLPSTAKELMEANPGLGLRMEDLKKAEVQEKLMDLYTNKSVKILEPLLGRRPTPGELYLTHLLGHAGGPAVLRNLDAPILDTIDSAAFKANKALLSPHRTGRQLVDFFNRKLGA